MSNHDAFYDAILAEPAADVHRLVYADWLDETSDPANAARAEYIRLQCELASSRWQRQHRPLWQRADALFREWWMDWWRPICQRLRLPEPDAGVHSFFGRLQRRMTGNRPLGWPFQMYEPQGPGQPLANYHVLKRHYGPAVPMKVQRFASAHFRRGFVEELDLSSETGAGGPSIADWLAAVPALSLWLAAQTAADFASEDTPALKNLRRLTLRLNDPNNAATCLWSPHLTSLEELAIRSRDAVAVSAAETTAILTAPAAVRVRRLEFENTTADVAEAVAVTHLPNLRELCLTTFVRDDYFAPVPVDFQRCFRAVADLRMRPDLEGLEFGDVAAEDVLPFGIQELCSQPWPSLRTLYLFSSFTAEQFAILSRSDAFPRLENLVIGFHGADVTAALEHFNDWPQLRRLTTLELSYHGGENSSAPRCAELLHRLVDQLDLDRFQSLGISARLHPYVAELLRPRLGNKLL